MGFKTYAKMVIPSLSVRGGSEESAIPIKMTGHNEVTASGIRSLSSFHCRKINVATENVSAK
jgi:hypothetical protein